jgi:hypothetical protein
MATKIRLARAGAKKKPFYHSCSCDVRGRSFYRNMGTLSRQESGGSNFSRKDVALVGRGDSQPYSKTVLSRQVLSKLPKLFSGMQ